MASLGKFTGQALVSYLALFRPAKQDLSTVRAVKLARETLELTVNHRALAAAMEQTANTIMAKRNLQNGEMKPLTNHNYLKQVLESTLPQFAAPVSTKTKTMEVKAQGFGESAQQNQQAFEAQLARYKGANNG